MVALHDCGVSHHLLQQLHSWKQPCDAVLESSSEDSVSQPVVVKGPAGIWPGRAGDLPSKAEAWI